MKGRGKWAITFLGLNLQQEFAQGLKELLKLPHGEPASISGLLTQEVLIPCGSWVVGDPWTSLGKHSPISISFLSHLEKVVAKAMLLRRHCLHPASTPKEESHALVLLLPFPLREHVDSQKAKEKDLTMQLWASWARHQGEPCRRSIRSSNHLFLRRGASEALLSATRNLPPVPWENNFVSQQQWKMRRKVNAVGNEKLWKLWHRQGMRRLPQHLRQYDLAVMGKDREKRYCKRS